MWETWFSLTRNWTSVPKVGKIGLWREEFFNWELNFILETLICSVYFIVECFYSCCLVVVGSHWFRLLVMFWTWKVDSYIFALDVNNFVAKMEMLSWCFRLELELQRDKQERDARERDLRERELRDMEFREKMKQELEMKPPGTLPLQDTHMSPIFLFYLILRYIHDLR